MTTTLLLCEDDELLRKLLVRTLQREDFDLVTAPDGQQALELVEELGRPIDMLITDVMMPNLDGQGLAKRLSARWPELPVLFISGYTREVLTARGHFTDDDIPLLVKPFHPQMLLSCIRRILALNDSLTAPEPTHRCDAPFSGSRREH